MKGRAESREEWAHAPPRGLRALLRAVRQRTPPEAADPDADADAAAALPAPSGALPRALSIAGANWASDASSWAYDAAASALSVVCSETLRREEE